jgi:hypothetical protein
MNMERASKLRTLRERTDMPMQLCDQALKQTGGDVDAAAELPYMSTRSTGDPFLGCPHNQGGGVGVSRRGQLYHIGCPEPHGQRRAG